MQKEKKDKIVWSQIFKKDIFYEQKDKTQNAFSIRCIILIFLLYSLMFILNVLNVFIVDSGIFIRSYAAVSIVLCIYLVLIHLLGIERPIIKYLNILTISTMVMFASCALTYHMIIIIVIPILFASMYANQTLVNFAFMLTILNIISSTYVGYYYGVCDANMALLTATSLANLSKDGVFLLNEVNTNPSLTLALYYILPRSVLAACFYLVSTNIYRIIEKNMEHAVRLKTRAATDDMTGMYNRNQLMDVISSKYYHNFEIAVIYWDVNNLKFVNDTYGHLSGDFLIVKIAESIRNALTDSADAFRYGGDEFIIIIKDGTAQKAEDIIQKWTLELEKLDHESDFAISASVGYAVGSGKDIKTIIDMADKEMYTNKCRYHASRQKQD